MVTLSDKEYTKINRGTFSSDIRCNYCGEAVTIEMEYEDHQSFEDYKCNCVGAKTSFELRVSLSEATRAKLKLEQELALHERMICSSIKQELFEDELNRLRTKFGMGEQL